MAESVDPVDRPAVGSAPPDDYALSVAALHALVAELPTHPPVTRARMFNGDGVKVREDFFAFIGRNGDLVAKLPEARVREVVGARSGNPVVMGSRTMRQWVRLPVEAGVGAWSAVLDEAYRFVLARPEP